MKNKTCGDCRFFESKEFICCHSGDEVAAHFIACIDFEPVTEQKLTNGDKIRQMSDGVLAFMMTRLILNGCPISGAKTIEDMKACKVSTDCTNCLKRLLEKEAKDE